MADYVEYRVHMKVEEEMLDHRTEIRRMLHEQREDNHMQIEHHFREFHHHKWVHHRHYYHPYMYGHPYWQEPWQGEEPHFN